MIGVLAAFGAVACASSEPELAPTPSVDVLRQAGDWPPHPAPAAVVRLTLQGCIQDIGHAPVVASEDRGFGVYFVLFGDAQTAGLCEVRQDASGSLSDVGGGAGGIGQRRGDAIVVASWDARPDRSFVMGVTPIGASAIRAVVGSHAVDGTVGGELFVVAWPNREPASLVVALDANHHEIARLDGDELARLFAPSCLPGSLQPCTP